MKIVLAGAFGNLGVNICAEGCILLATIILHKAGLAERENI